MSALFCKRTLLAKKKKIRVLMTYFQTMCKHPRRKEAIAPRGHSLRGRGAAASNRDRWEIRGRRRVGLLFGRPSYSTWWAPAKNGGEVVVAKLNVVSDDLISASYSLSFAPSFPIFIDRELCVADTMQHYKQGLQASLERQCYIPISNWGSIWV